MPLAQYDFVLEDSNDTALRADHYFKRIDSVLVAKRKVQLIECVRRCVVHSGVVSADLLPCNRASLRLAESLITKLKYLGSDC